MCEKGSRNMSVLSTHLLLTTAASPFNNILKPELGYWGLSLTQWKVISLSREKSTKRVQKMYQNKPKLDALQP